jgi:DNA polymerase I
LQLRLKLSGNDNEKETTAKQRVKQASERKAAANESMEDAWQRLSESSFNEKELREFEAARSAYSSGLTGRVSTGKFTKKEALQMGRIVLEERERELRQQRIAQTLDTKPDNYFVITDDKDLPAFVGRLREEVKLQREQWPDRFKVLGVESMTAGDFEGTGIDSYMDLSIGFSIWLPILNEGYYLAYGHVDMRGEPGFEFLNDDNAHKKEDPQLTRSKVLEAITPYLSQDKHGKTFHMGSARYDLHIANNDGYQIRGCVWDTLDAMNLMNEHEPAYGLKPLIQKYGKEFGITGTVFTFEDLFGNRSPAPFSIELTGIYAINDVKYGWFLFDWQFKIMSKTHRLLDCYAEVDSKLPETDVFMERCGFIVDLEQLKALESEFTPKIEEATKRVFTTYGIDAEFICKMDRSIKKNNIAKWITAQKKRIQAHEDKIAKKQTKVSELEANKKTHTKMYQQEKELLAKYKTELANLAEPIIDNAPQEITEFSMTNGNHLAYLIYDHLGIEDRTKKIDRNKSRSTAADVLAMYYEDEPALEPLATVAEYEKLLSTYIRPMLGSNGEASVLEIDGRLHSNFKAGGTATGRYSSSTYTGRPTDLLDEFRGSNVEESIRN